MQSAQDDSQSQSALHSQMMALLAQGMLSGAIVHGLAQAAVKDLQGAKEGHTFPTVERLGKIAQGRKSIRSVYGELAKACPLPQPYKVEMPFKSCKVFYYLMHGFQLCMTTSKLGGPAFCRMIRNCRSSGAFLKNIPAWSSTQ